MTDEEMTKELLLDAADIKKWIYSAVKRLDYALGTASRQQDIINMLQSNQSELSIEICKAHGGVHMTEVTEAHV